MFRQIIFQDLFLELLHALVTMANRHQLWNIMSSSVKNRRIEGLRIWNGGMESSIRGQKHSGTKDNGMEQDDAHPGICKVADNARELGTDWC